MKVRKFRTFVYTITLYFQLFYSVMCSLNNELLTNYLGNLCSLSVQELFLSYICCTTKCPFQKIKHHFQKFDRIDLLDSVIFLKGLIVWFSNFSISELRFLNSSGLFNNNFLDFETTVQYTALFIKFLTVIFAAFRNVVASTINSFLVVCFLDYFFINN